MNLVAQLNMKEFDPTCERHYPLLIVKAVDPGCTIELQIENAQTGKVHRLTTTDEPARDDRVMTEALVEAFRQSVQAFMNWRMQP